MSIPTSKPLSMSTVQTEYGGSNPISLSEYYSKGNAPASGAITLWEDFNGTQNEVTATSVSQEWNWYGDDTLSTEDSAISADMIDVNTSRNDGVNAYNLNCYIDTGEPWLGKTITGYSNLSIEHKVTMYKDTTGGNLAESSVIYRALDKSTGVTIATLNTDTHTNGTGLGLTETRTAVTNADITGAMTDAQIKQWITDGCPLEARHLDDDDGFANVDTPDSWIIRFKADSITYIP